MALRRTHLLYGPDYYDHCYNVCARDTALAVDAKRRGRGPEIAAMATRMGLGGSSEDGNGGIATLLRSSQEMQALSDCHGVSL